MKKTFLFLFLLSGSVFAMAGGLATNTNQSVAFLRNPARTAAIDVDGAYFNPAGTAFLSNGIHVGLSLQTAIQTRTIENTYAPLALGVGNDATGIKNFKGNALAPVIPGVHIVYNWDRWNFMAHFGVTGGGGKCEFKNGLGMFESALASQAYAQTAKYGTTINYNMNSSITGTQYTFGLLVGTSYEAIREHLSVSLGVRVVYMYNRYEGSLKDMTLLMGSTPVYKGADVSLDCRQQGWGATPVIGLDYRINSHWNLAVKYECPTYIKLRNNADNNEAAQAMTALSDYQDGVRNRNDLPGIISAGVQYSPIHQVRLAASYSFYDDKHAVRATDTYKNNKGTHDAGFSIEGDVCKYLTLSAGWEGTYYGLSDAEMTDLSFNLSSNSLNVGMRIHCNDHWKLDLGYMHSFYMTRDVTRTYSEALPLSYTSHFNRSNDVVGIGLVYDM